MLLWPFSNLILIVCICFSRSSQQLSIIEHYYFIKQSLCLYCHCLLISYILFNKRGDITGLNHYNVFSFLVQVNLHVSLVSVVIEVSVEMLQKHEKQSYTSFRTVIQKILNKFDVAVNDVSEFVYMQTHFPSSWPHFSCFVATQQLNDSQLTYFCYTIRRTNVCCKPSLTELSHVKAVLFVISS